MGAINKRLDKLEAATNQDQDNTRITVIEVFGDRGNGEELAETYELKNGRWIKHSPGGYGWKSRCQLA